MSSLSVLMLGVVVGAFVVFALRRQTGTYVSVSSLLVANFVLTEQVSGIAALAPHGLPFAWNINLAAGEYGEYVLTSAWISLAGLLALATGMLVGRNPRRASAGSDSEEAGSQIDLARVYVFAGACAALALYGLPRARGLASDNGSIHILETPAGSYKYVILSNWLACAAVIFGTAFIAARRKRAPLTVVAVVAATLIISVAATGWSGARSLALLIWLPLLIALWPRIKRYSLPIGALILVVVGSLVIRLTNARQASDSGLDLLSPLSILDWQWGRFSMTPLALHLSTTVEGSHGGALYASVYPPLSFLAGVAHLPLPGPTTLSSNALIGSVSLGSSSNIYIPFGLQGELVFNFGWPGVIVGFLILGRVARHLDSWIRRESHPILKLLPSYLGSVLVLRVLQGNLGGVVDLVLFTGLPFILLHLWIRSTLRRNRSGELPPDSEQKKRKTGGRRGPERPARLAGRPN